MPADGWSDDSTLRDLLQSLTRLAMRMAPSADAEDIAVEALLATIQRLDEGRAIQHPRAYAYRIVCNLSYDAHRRRERTEPRPPGDLVGASLDAQFDRLVEEDAVIDRLRPLSEREREVVLLRYYEDLSNTEIGHLLGIEPSSVSTYLRRARERLARYDDPEETDGT